MPGFAFPAVGPLGLGSPRSRRRPLSSSAPSVLGSAKTARCPSRVASLIARFPVPRPASLLRVPPVGSSPAGWKRPADARALGPTGTPALPVLSVKETVGSPKFPSYPCGCMPRSQTPVVSCPLALAQPGLLPSAV